MHPNQKRTKKKKLTLEKQHFKVPESLVLWKESQQWKGQELTNYQKTHLCLGSCELVGL